MTQLVHATTTLSDRVEIGGDCYIGPYCILGGPGFQHRDWGVAEFASGDGLPTRVGAGFRMLGFGAVGAGSILGARVRCDFHAVIGEQCQVGDDVVLEYGARVYDSCVIGDECTVGGFVCNDAVIGSGSVVQGALVHKRTSKPPEAAPVLGNRVFIGTHAVVIGGVVVADDSFIAAGAVVTVDTESGYLYAGVPARRIGRRSWM